MVFYSFLVKFMLVVCVIFGVVIFVLFVLIFVLNFNIFYYKNMLEKDEVCENCEILEVVSELDLLLNNSEEIF